ncbi:MAG: SDR family oxidoreductase [Planctomycetes bacterium]|nr:SDR family oxidoreductase [Planctomycetota bacterium]
MSLKSKVIIVTGGTSGIGEACSRHFARLGAKVVAASIQRKEGRTLAKVHGVHFVHADVSDEKSVQSLVSRTLELHGRIDALVSNAGVLRMGPVSEFDEAMWDAVMGVNVKGNLWLAKHVAPVMKGQGRGVICITTSVAAFVGFPNHTLYCASKGALEALVRSLAVELAGYARVVGVCPGTIDTPMLASSCKGWAKPVAEIYAEVEKKIPVRRLGTPLDMARAIAFLISDEAAYINATCLVMDGGTLALPPW